MKSKKAQSSLEFMIIFVFVLIIVVFVSYAIGIFSVGIQNDRTQAQRDDVASIIINEFELFQEVEGGYIREINISKDLVDRYNFTFYNDSFTMEDKEVFGDDSDDLFVYELPGNNNEGINFNYNQTTGVLVMIKNYVEQREILSLE